MISIPRHVPSLSRMSHGMAIGVSSYPDMDETGTLSETLPKGIEIIQPASAARTCVAVSVWNQSN